jgi:hypothetical protein
VIKPNLRIAGRRDGPVPQSSVEFTKSSVNRAAYREGSDVQNSELADEAVPSSLKRSPPILNSVRLSLVQLSQALKLDGDHLRDPASLIFA